MKLPLEIISLVILLTTCCLQVSSGEPDSYVTFQPEVDIDGFTIDEQLTDIVEGEQHSREEYVRETESESETELDSADHRTRHPFEKVCPLGFFACANGECLSPRWRCDGRYDCDDNSDELNCTIDLAHDASYTKMDTLTKPSAPKAVAPPILREEVSEIKFNSSQEPLMLFSTGLSIRGYWMRSRIYFDIVARGAKPVKSEAPSITQALSIFFDIINVDRGQSAATKKGSEEMIKARSTIVGVDMDPSNKEVYWVELGKDPGVFSTIIDNDNFESRSKRQFNSHRTIVDSGLLSPEDIALDRRENIYITDAGLPAIVVCSIKHSHCKIIVKDNLHKPRAILADSSTGWLTYTDWGDHPGIFLVTMDGKKRETLIDENIAWPNGLAADYSANYLYWADARLSKIERVDLTTRKRKEIVRESAANPFSLSMFENRIYWSDWSGSDIRTCDKNFGNSTKVIMRTENIYGIHIYHPSVSSKSDQSNPCWSKHCTHMCLLAPTANTFAERKAGSVSASCACPESMALSMNDRATCYEAELAFLLINVKNYIAQVFPERIGLHLVEKVIYSKLHAIHDAAADWHNFKLYFFDAAKQYIYEVELVDRIRVEEFMPTNHSVRGLLHDSWSDNLYWLDSDGGSMTMCSIQGRFEKVLRTNLTRPISLALDSRNRVFYIALLGITPHIMRTDIFADKESDLIIIGTDIGLPVALHLDEKHQRLYWADARHETIESLDMDVKSASGIVHGSRLIHRKRLGTILAFAVYYDSFVWTIKNGDYLYKAKIGDEPHGGLKAEESVPIALKLPPNPSADEPASDNKRIILIDPGHGPTSSPCHMRGCSHGCVLDSNHNTICICPSDYKIQASNSSNCVSASHEDCDTTASAAAITNTDPSYTDGSGNRMVWLIVLLLLLSVTGLVTLVSLLILYKQGRLPRQVSQLSVSFVSQNHDKDGAMLLLDNES